MRGFGGRWRALGSGAGAATAIGVLIVLSAFSGGAASRPGTPVPPAAALLHLAITGTGCSGAGVPTRFTGQLSDLGGPTPRPSIANQTVALTVHYDQDFFPFGGNATRQCLATTHSATTGSLGSFSISASIPTNYCVKSIGCWNFTGPYGPATFNLTGSGSVPPGDYLTQSIWGSSVTLSRVAALDRVALDPSGFATVSVLAPSNLSASALAGDGSASPAAPSYAWRIVGSGWSFLSATTVARPVVEAQAGAAVATAELWVNGSFGGAALHLPPVSVILTAAATSVTAGAVAPTSVDAGEPTTFSYSGTGAVGYPYTASVSPGLGLPPVAATCRASQLSGGLDRLDCAATIDYPDAGIAQPSANLSNGYSTATWDFAPVTVASALDVRVVPAPALAYRDAPVTFALSVAAGTGTPPFGPACLDPGSGGFECDNGPGPTWTFDVAYPSTGNFSARLTASDAGGSSWARTVPIRIVDRPQLAPLALASSIVGLGGELSADTSVSGGGLPISFWWNLSTPASTVASGTLTNDGPIALDAALAELGPGRLTLTLVDALGTRSSSVADYVVLPETATEIVALGPSNDSIAAGRPLSLSFEALDGLGNRVIGFVGPVAIVVHGSDGPTLWVNASQSGPVPPSASGGFDPPSTAWRSGYLNLTLASVLAGSISVALEAAPGVLGTPPWPITVVPDTSREHLFGPTPPAALDRSPGTDSALYQIRDRFGNPLDGGYVVIRTLDRGTVLTVIDSPIFVRSGLSMVWVN
ncbi:MAG TPA: hypothetical protein VGV64_01935, partial [Thermoplasmata archaeon]|nr:hypothetical protein [Thermoplasmata archaeon]